MVEVHQRFKGHHLIRIFESDKLRKGSFLLKAADKLTLYFGTVFFLLLNVGFIVAWVIINSGKLTDLTPFDPFPFFILSVSLSVYAILLSIVVLISQNRESQTASLRQELQLQVNLITEKEITKVLKILKELREEIKKGKIKDEELEEMVKEVDYSYIERKIAEQLEHKEETFAQAVTEPLEKLLKK
jgi:uncharacterized membrane protein